MKFKTILDIISSLLIIIVFFYLRLSEPSLTGTELFFKFWPSYFLMSIVVLLMIANTKN